ncbi:DUF3107 domain-containing protein [Nocardioides sp. GY 10113]|uniref:DUF3107 domain-containing protein n=1 Tax=Nocardioides sp. GY 10113 TaxID=2569761 RepID=UPI0010A75B11|nr:DUF3107 domain-containing protein [Nocardioides sp. GY 10113]TIC81265.1 DUF3107 domain-containing protein [Nocardioides sp. GY 10113]
MTVEVKIGVQNAARELHVETEESSEAVSAALSEALAADSGVFSLTDAKGKVTLVPVAKLAYVEIGRSVSGQVGFRS